MKRAGFHYLTLVIMLVVTACSRPNPGPNPTPVVATPTQAAPGQVSIDKIEILKLAGQPEQVRVLVSGQISDPCTLVGDPGVAKNSAGFQISLPTNRPGGVTCSAFQVPFEKVIPLDVSGLKDGSYRVSVNGMESSFQYAVASAPAGLPITAGNSSSPTQPSQTTQVTSGATVSVTATTAPGSISGMLWQDLCSQDQPGNCAKDGDSFQPDGIHQANEPGIPGATIDIGNGACPSTGSATTLTGSDGGYSFPDLAAGVYCVSVPSDAGQNGTLLAKGTWTAPLLGNGSITVNLDQGGAKKDASFGWGLPSWSTAASNTCVNKAAFEEDVTIPDNTGFQQGESFVKTWRISNAGTCTWDNTYAMIFAGGDPLGAAAKNPLGGKVQPGDRLDVSVKMVAPTNGGAYTSIWELSDPNGTPFGFGASGRDKVWVKIGVSYGSQISNPAPPPASQPVSSTTSTCNVARDASFENTILSLVNDARASQGLPALTLQPQLTAAAVLHSTDMACHDSVSHTGSDGSLWYDRIKSQGYPYSYASENIYVGNPAYGGDANGAFTWWMNSQVHRDNILSRSVTQIGIGYVYDDNSTYGGYYTIDFAKP